MSEKYSKDYGFDEKRQKKTYSKVEKKCKWGLFMKRGWRCICLFTTEEHALEYLENKDQRLYEIRKVEWYD